MKYIHRFYGSCGHVVDTESRDWFDKFASTAGNEVTVEGEAHVVHVHPHRYCPCQACVEGDLANEAAHYKRLSAFMPKVCAKDDRTWLEVKSILRAFKPDTVWISNEDMWASFEKRIPPDLTEQFLAVGATIEAGIGLTIDDAVDEILRLVRTTGGEARRQQITALLRRIDIPDDLWTVDYIEPHKDAAGGSCHQAFYTLASNQAEVFERLPEVPGREKRNKTWYPHHHTRGGRIVPLERVGEAASEFLKDKCLHEPVTDHGGDRRCRQCGKNL